MTNLFDFLFDWNPSVKIYVESKEEIVYSGLIADIDVQKAMKYWVVEGSVKLNDEATYILVEHEDEMNKKLEEQNEVSFQAIWKSMLEDEGICEETIHSFHRVVNHAKDYVFCRKNWNQFPVEMIGKYDKERSVAHDIFISALDDYASLIEKQTGSKVPWRVDLGNDRHMIGEFAEYIIDRIEVMKERIVIVEAIIWAQDHRNQIVHCIEESINDQDAKRRIMNMFNFNYNQAQAIIDSRLKLFNKTGRIKLHEELVELLNAARPYEGFL